MHWLRAWVVIGIAMDNIGVGIALGTSLGIAIGVAMAVGLFDGAKSKQDQEPPE